MITTRFMRIRGRSSARAAEKPIPLEIRYGCWWTESIASSAKSSLRSLRKNLLLPQNAVADLVKRCEPFLPNYVDCPPCPSHPFHPQKANEICFAVSKCRDVRTNESTVVKSI